MARAERIVYHWDEAAWTEFRTSGAGPTAPLWHAIGEIVVKGVRRRALVRTGAMRASAQYELTEEADGIGVTVSMPVKDPKTGTEYAIFHERAKPRDRRPHRSLVPAMGDVPPIM